MPGNNDLTSAAAAETARSPSFARALSPAPAPVKRDKFIGFVRDEASATLLHETLAGHLPNTNQVHTVDFRHALTLLATMTTPEIVLVDLSGEDQPINALLDLADVVEAGTVVLAIGEIQTVNFYRTITKGMGIREYLPKPLTRAAIEQNFLPLIANLTHEAALLRGGRMVVMTGARGGAGTTTIASNLAWYIATELHRHTVLLDGELNTGTVALNLNLPTNNGLVTALETPERVDGLLIERAVQEAGDRLHVLAGLEDLGKTVSYTPEAAVNFLQTVRSRYNFVIADAGAQLSAFARDLLFNAQRRVIVMDPTIVSIRNLERLLALPAGSAQSPRVTLVLNKAGTPGGLAQGYMEQVMGVRFDAVIPDLPRIVPHATQLGNPAAELRGPFRNGIADLARALGAAGKEEA